VSPAPESPAVRGMLDRVRTALPGGDQREVRMFGAVAVMLDGAMAVAVHEDASLLVRVDPARDGELVTRPGASRATMGASRSMGPGWVHVDAAALDGDAELADWLHHATSYLRRRAGVGDP
jgi:TfoX/Sxy family transcriptional regulator of competence genes